jgi:hypothetical protein
MCIGVSAAAVAEPIRTKPSTTTSTEGSSAGLSSGSSGITLVVLTVSAIGATFARIKRGFTGSRGQDAPKHRSPIRSGFDTATRLTLQVQTRNRTNQPDELLPTERAHESDDLTFRLATAC